MKLSRILPSKKEEKPKHFNSAYIFNGTLYLFDKEGNQICNPIKPSMDISYSIEEDKQ